MRMCRGCAAANDDPSDHLPTPQERLKLFEVARDLFVADGYDEIGIDHFALPTDGLAQAQKNGQLRRNFQGYTDDQAEALVGLGASSISRFPQGYAQNASATSKHTGAIREGSFPPRAAMCSAMRTSCAGA